MTMYSDLVIENAAPGVHELPPEVLTVIFHDLQHVLGWSIPSAWQSLGPVVRLQTTWVRISWVCRYWREVALSSPRLWSTITDSKHWKNMDWLPTFLERSRQTPLDVGIWSSAAVDPASILAPLVPHAPRIHSLYLRARKSTPLSTLLAPFKDGFPVLEEIVLREWPDLEVLDVLDLSPCRFPRLRTISLNHVALSWDPENLFRSLECLVMTRCRHEGPPPTTLRRLLRQSPEIEILKLNGKICSEADTVEAPHPSERLSLTHMRQLALRGSALPLSWFLDNLILPSSTHVSLDYEMHDYVDTPSGISMIMPRQSAFEALLSCWSSLSVDIDGRSVSIGAKGNHHSRGSLRLTAFVFQMVNLTAVLWDDILDAFSRCPLTHVEVNYHSLANITSDMWSTLFTRFPHLATLSTSAEGEVDYRGDLSLLEALFNALRFSYTSEGELCGSRLRTLVLTDFTIDKPVADAVLRLLRFRRANRAPLQRLVFRATHCKHDIDAPDFLVQLEELVNVDIMYNTGQGAVGFRYLDETTAPTEQGELHGA